MDIIINKNNNLQLYSTFHPEIYPAYSFKPVPIIHHLISMYFALAQLQL